MVLLRRAEEREQCRAMCWNVEQVRVHLVHGFQPATTLALQISRAGELAHWLVRTSNLHPAFRDSPMVWDMLMGGYADPTTGGLEKQFEGFTVALQRAAYDRALALVAARRGAIEAMAEELLDDSKCVGRAKGIGQTVWQSVRQGVTVGEGEGAIEA